MTEFVAIDGEAIGGGADARYALLAASTGEHIWNVDGLSTRQCLEFLLDRNTHSKIELVGFGTGYDINQWIVDLTEPELRELWETGSVIHQGYLIEWLRGRRLFIKDLRRRGRSVYVQETFGFFQSSFVRALADWGLQPPQSMETMKLARGTFTDTQRQRVIDYCLSECRMLVRLMNLLDDAVTQAGCRPRPHMWIGAGQLASQLLAGQGIKPHHAHDRQVCPNDRAYTALLSAYFGGRAELLRQGTRQSVNTYDLRSAYPWAATLLPGLAGAGLQHRRRYDPTVEHGIWRCRWNGLCGQLMPFPVRVKKTISYPRSGEGWYHAIEIRTALELGHDIQVGEGYVLAHHGAGRTFDFDRPFARAIPELFRLRDEFKRDGNAAQKALKLALNSLYGKTAQGFTDQGDAPRWQSYLWAGEITARTRSRMLKIAASATDPMMIATDGLFCARANAGRETGKLGSWERGQLDWLFCAQPGVYWGRRDGEDVLKSRGFFVKDVDYDALHAGWVDEGPGFVYSYSSHRFLGLGQALQRTAGLELWRQWIDAPRQINLMPQRKRLMRAGRRDGWICLPIEHAGGESEPYRPKGKLLESDDDDNAAALDQPLRDTI